jgi:hypothetical protein
MGALYAPRPPLERSKSGSLDYPDNYDRAMSYWRDALLRQGAEEMQACGDLQRATDYIKYLDGQYWDPDRPEFRSKYSDNTLMDQRLEAIAALSDIRPTIDISCAVEEYQAQSEIVLNVLRSVWQTQRIQSKQLREWIDHALFGTGFLKLVGCEPGEMQFSAHALGMVIPIQMEQNQLQTAEAVVYRAYKSLSYFLRKFGRDKCQDLERYSVNVMAAIQGDKYTRPNNIPEYQWSSLSPAMKRRMHLSRNTATGQGAPNSMAQPFPVIELQEIYHADNSYNDYGHPVLVKDPDKSVRDHNYHYIVPSGSPMFPRKRLTVFGGDRVLYDGPSPFWDGQYPFAMLQLNPTVWGPGGVSKYRDILPLVKTQNRLVAGVEECSIDAVNRNVITRKGAIDPLSWDRFDPSRPKQKIMLNGTANPGSDFKYMDAKQLPQYTLEAIKYLDGRINRRTGALDIQGLSRKKQQPSGEVMQTLQDAMSGPYRLECEQLESAMCEAGQLGVSRIFQFYTLDQRLRMLGPDGQTWQDYDYVAANMVPAHSPKEDHWRAFAFLIAPGTLHGAQKYQKSVIALNLRKVRDISRKSLFRILDVGLNADQEMAELKKEAAEMPPPPPKGQGRQQRMTRQERQGSGAPPV